MNANQTTDTNRYGAFQSNGLVDGAAYHAQVDYTRFWTLAEVAEAKGTITRLRLLTERIGGVLRVDVSYVNATLPNGQIVNVQNGVDNLTPMRELKGELIAWAKREGVYAKGLGLLDSGNWSVQY